MAVTAHRRTSENVTCDIFFLNSIVIILYKHATTVCCHGYCLMVQVSRMHLDRKCLCIQIEAHVITDGRITWPTDGARCFQLLSNDYWEIVQINFSQSFVIYSFCYNPVGHRVGWYILLQLRPTPHSCGLCTKCFLLLCIYFSVNSEIKKRQASNFIFCCSFNHKETWCCWS